jgi:hypothetical protein
MPWIDVNLYDHRVTEESVPTIIESLTSALGESSGAAPEHIQVGRAGHPAPALVDVVAAHLPSRSGPAQSEVTP